MMLNPFQFVKILKMVKQQGGMYLCESCIKKGLSRVTPEELESAYNKSMGSGMYKTMEKAQPCFLCENPTNLMMGIKDSMAAIGQHVKGGHRSVN